VSVAATSRRQEARQRDSVRVSVARRGLVRGLRDLAAHTAMLGRLETRVVLVDVSVDLNAAKHHLTLAAAALERISRSLKEPT
jgi:hypothetical protein